MKKKLLTLFTFLICTSVFAQFSEVELNNLKKTLEKNKKSDISFYTKIEKSDFIIDGEGNVKIPLIESEKYNVLVSGTEKEFLKERIEYNSSNNELKVYFKLTSLNPKNYTIISIVGIESASEYKFRIGLEQFVKESERIAEEKKNEAARIAEERKQRSAKYLPTYETHLSKAKKYESEKRWCYALGSYYDAMGTVGVDPEFKSEAVKGYNLLKESILSGNPGFGTYDEFTIYEEWKKLLIDAEKYGCSFNPYLVEVGELVKGNLDYQTKTVTYSAKIKPYRSYRYSHTLEIIEKGYEKGYKNGWPLISPSNWPKYSVSYNDDDVLNVNGAYIFRRDEYNLYGKLTGYSYLNAFSVINYPVNVVQSETTTLIDCKFNIVDEKGKELVKPKRFLVGSQDYIYFEKIPMDIMNLIDKGKAFIYPIACYLEYGKFNLQDSKGGRSFIKNFPEIELPMNTAEFVCWNNKYDKTYYAIEKIKEYEQLEKSNKTKEKILASFDVENLYKINSVDFDMILIPEKKVEIAKTETTQELYEEVMNRNPSYFNSMNNPVECVSWYDAIYFCNKLSIAKGFTPVYAVDGNFDFNEWNYTPHQGNSIKGKVTQNTSANGYRLPTVEEWQYAAKGGQDYTYAGSNEINEVAWYDENSNKKTHPIAQKKANGYGLYDMSGNVWEWCWDFYSSNYDCRYQCGGGWYVDYGIDYGDGYDSICRVSSSDRSSADGQYKDSGFRIIRSVK